MSTTEIGVDLSRYKLGWSDEEDYVYKPKKGLNEEIILSMSSMKDEPDWMRDFRLKSYQRFTRRRMPTWGGDLNGIDFNDIYYYIKPTNELSDDWDDVPESIKNTYEKLGIPEAERKYLAGVTAQYESEVVYHRNREALDAQGVIFCAMDTALRAHPELVDLVLALVSEPALDHVLGEDVALQQELVVGIQRLERLPQRTRGGLDLRQLLRRQVVQVAICLLYTSPSPRDGLRARMPSSA